MKHNAVDRAMLSAAGCAAEVGNVNKHRHGQRPSTEERFV